jgi:hypothetical protein
MHYYYISSFNASLFLKDENRLSGSIRIRAGLQACRNHARRSASQAAEKLTIRIKLCRFVSGYAFRHNVNAELSIAPSGAAGWNSIFSAAG